MSVADARPAASLEAAAHFPVPAYLPALVRPVLPWTRRHVARVAARYQASRDDLWDEAVTALLRAAVYYDAAAGVEVPPVSWTPDPFRGKRSSRCRGPTNRTQGS